MTPLDYGRSFVIGTGTGSTNECRFWIESRLRIIDGDTTEDYLQGASCKSEHTFVATDLFQEDNYDFLPIFGREHGIIFRRKAYLNDNYKSYVAYEDLFGGVSEHLVEASQAQLLETTEQVREATHRFAPIVAQTEIADESTGLRAILECPVKTMNTQRDIDMYQVDTGPILFPDLSHRHARHVEAIALAFVAFNVPHFADFVVERPTEIESDGGESCQVHHYSELISLLSVNRLYAL